MGGAGENLYLDGFKKEVKWPMTTSTYILTKKLGLPFYCECHNGENGGINQSLHDHNFDIAGKLEHRR